MSELVFHPASGSSIRLNKARPVRKVFKMVRKRQRANIRRYQTSNTESRSSLVSSDKVGE